MSGFLKDWDKSLYLSSEFALVSKMVAQGWPWSLDSLTKESGSSFPSILTCVELAGEVRSDCTLRSERSRFLPSGRRIPAPPLLRDLSEEPLIKVRDRSLNWGGIFEPWSDDSAISAFKRLRKPHEEITQKYRKAF
ncbi:hypothetical protein TNCV_3434591 [Trichonephila clavipes]|nr:hypothetical protein TNCV_3434591 [Trichonephila clavipes]